MAMRRRLLLMYLWIFGLLLLGGASLAQTPTPSVTPTPTPVPLLRAVVQVDSSFIRQGPSRETPAVSSVFLDDVLIIVGRNSDGTWFEVRRIGRQTNLGWIFNEMLDWDFTPTGLPITDTTTGVIGPTPVIDTGINVLMLAEVYLRSEPNLRATTPHLIPIITTLPVVGRNQDASWIQVNYLGYIGWVSGFLTRRPANLLEAPITSTLAPAITRVIIPPELQIAQLDRFREYVIASDEVAAGLVGFWSQVSQGTIMPCEPPPFVTDYLYTDRDVQQLPELDRLVPRFNEAIELLNDAIEPLTQCGVIDLERVNEARRAAINAGVIFDASLDQITNVRRLIR